MAESPEDLVARAIAGADRDGRLAIPPVADWDTFPFEGDIRVRPFRPEVTDEEPRRGEYGVDCWRCEHDLEGAIWSDDHWLVSSLEKPSGLPVVVLLFPRAHHDIDDLPIGLADELGMMIQRVESAVREVGDIGRVHISRWGDGSAHLHWWFQARPAGVPQLRGSFAAIWDDILPPLPERVWTENLAIVARALAASGGISHV